MSIYYYSVNDHLTIFVCIHHENYPLNLIGKDLRAREEMFFILKQSAQLVRNCSL
jgi:hypothetical protein